MTILVAIGGLAALGIGVPASGLVVALRGARDDRAAAVDRQFAKLRQRLRPGERVGLVITDHDTENEEVARAKYALAPAIVEPLHARDCMAGASEHCRFHLVEYVALPLPRSDVTAALERRLELVPGEALDEIHLLRRRTR